MSNTTLVTSDWYAEVPRSAKIPIACGFTILLLGVIGFGAWAATAPIAGAVVTAGVFVATGQNKIIQHLEGGVIKRILVREGDVVEPGQTLIELDDTAPKAELRRLLLRQARSRLMEARLEAEIREADSVIFPPDLVATNDPEIAALVESQRMTFEARRKNLRTDIAAIEDAIRALEERIAGTQVQLQAVHRQIEFFDEELAAKTTLVNSGLVRKPELLAVQRARANMQGEVGRLTGDIGDAKERISRARQQIRGVRQAAIKAAVEQLQDVRADLNDVGERIRQARGILDRIMITAPVRGAVVKLRYHTPGGVIEPGKNIMEILPLQDDLIIEARVRPQDIAHVKTGQAATVRLTALSQRVTPMINGEVIYVSADAVPDEQKGERTTGDIYVARVKLNPGDAAQVHGFVPTPGMPAEVYIKTDDRTFFDYLTRPIRDSMTRAFREP